MNCTNTNLPSFIKPESNDAQRLFHGRGHIYDGLSHVCIDWYAPVVFIFFYEEVDQNWLNCLINRIQFEIPQCESIQVQFRCRQKSPVELFWGKTVKSLVVTEHQLKYQLILSTNQNNGLFLDMSNGRKWVIENSKNKRVLNLFAYTCAFSVCAIAGGANYVLNLDMNKKALSQGRANHQLNEQNLARIKYTGVNLFKSWSKLRREDKFNLLICDPPSYQKGSIDLSKDYKKIVKRIPEFMAENSDILLCINAPNLDQEFIKNLIKDYCPDCIFQKQIENPKVFKDAHKGKGLKVMHFIFKPAKNEK